MRIGELAKRTGCQVETIRYYEREGLLHEPARSERNYRLYDGSHLERLSFIRNCRALEMSLREITTLLGIKDQSDQDCGEVNALLDDHIGHVADRIAKLQLLQAQLIALREQCQQTWSVTNCAILKELSEPSANGLSTAKKSAAHVHGTHS